MFNNARINKGQRLLERFELGIIDIDEVRVRLTEANIPLSAVQKLEFKRLMGKLESIEMAEKIIAYYHVSSTEANAMPEVLAHELLELGAGAIEIHIYHDSLTQVWLDTPNQVSMSHANRYSLIRDRRSYIESLFLTPKEFKLLNPSNVQMANYNLIGQTGLSFTPFVESDLIDSPRQWELEQMRFINRGVAEQKRSQRLLRAKIASN